MPNTSARPKHGRRARRRRRVEPARDQLVSSSLESAQQCLLNQDYGTAFVHYLLVLNLAPVFKDFAQDSFRFTLFKWAEELDAVGRIQELFDCYEQALEIFPADEVILNSMGEHLFRMGFRDEAAGHFHKALKLKPDYPEARENFYRVANWLVERWHFLMLNDHGRNRKYQQAIHKAVQSGCSTVLDIGTGTGILGMCAKKAGAAEVYACELSKTMYELACEVVAANGMEGSIKILHKKSLDMEVPTDLPHRVSLVVTETVDAGLFGEGIIESLIHAWHHLLLPPERGDGEFRGDSTSGRVIPAGATVFCMAVECLEIRRHHRLCAAEVGGLPMAAAGELRSPVSCNQEQDDSTEPYTTERLSRLPGGYRALTEPFTALTIDFNNVQELEGLSSREVREIRLPVNQGGELDALAVWFQLHLDEENSLSTGPEEDTCWEQAIYPVHSAMRSLSCWNVIGSRSQIVFQDRPIVNCVHISGDFDFPVHTRDNRHTMIYHAGFALKPRDELIVDVSCRDAYLRLCCVAVLRDGHKIYLDKRVDLQNPGKPAPNPNPEVELCSALACLQTGPSESEDFCMLECSEMALLNNQDYHQSFRLALTKLLSELKFKNGNPNTGGTAVSAVDSGLRYVLDVSEGFSLLSLIAARQGQVKAYSSVEKTKQQNVLRRLAQANGISEQHLEFWLNHTEDEQGVLQRPSREKLWTAIILDCVETCGLIRQKLMEKASLARFLLEEGGRIFPGKIVVYGMLVESDTLLLESAVQGREPTLGFNIAPFINQFTVPVHVFLDFSTLECRHLSEALELFVLDLMEAMANYTEREVKVQAIAGGRITAIPFWYQIHLDQDVSVSTLSRTSHWKQAAVVLQEPLEVHAGDWIRLAVKLHKSTISIAAHIDDAPAQMD